MVSYKKHYLPRLSDLDPGQKAVVHSIETLPPSVYYRLQSLGIYGGSVICIKRKFPDYLFRVGYTLIAMDHALAAKIKVRKLPPSSHKS